MTTSYQIETVAVTSARQDHMIDTRRTIQMLKALRRNFDLAHEVGHVTLSLSAQNHGGMTAVLDTLRLSDLMQAPVADWPTVPAVEALQLSSTLKIPRVSLSSERPQSWQIKAALVFAWREHAALDQDLDDVLDRWPAPGRMDVLYRENLLSQDDRLAVRRTLDASLRIFCCVVALCALGFQRRHVRVFVLAMIAVCRRYGRRSEPDDHASLLISRHLVSMGSCPPI